MHVCFFDIDGTLIHTGGAGTAALGEAMRSAFGVAQPASVGVHGRTDRAITADLFRLHGVEDRPEHWDRFRAAYLVHLRELLAARSGVVLPGIVELLDALRRRDDLVIGLLTGNTREGARIKLGHYRLDGYFEFGGFGDDHLDRCDVAREALAAVRARLNGNVDVERVWVIGDTPGDVRCGRAIGARVIAVATGSHSYEELAREQPDVLAPDFSDPARVLALWA